jgi:ferredoxin-type protein NapH
VGKKAAIRLKVLRAVRRTRHRYDRLRALSMSVSFATLLVVPLSGLARVDLWQGRHALLFDEVPLRHGLAGVVVGISAMYVVTFLANVLAGRMFCGWGCPVGQLSRFGEVLDTPRLAGAARLRARVTGGAFSVLLVLAILAWWVDLRVLWAGAGRELAIAWGVLVAGITAAHAHGRWWRWRFCQTACPIGLYYSFVSPAKWYGVYFRNAQGSCIECDACDHVCPVDLAPRDLLAPVDARGGASIADAPGRNHCLECGDCIRACEFMIAASGTGPVPLLLGHYRGAQRIDRVVTELAGGVSRKGQDRSRSRPASARAP